VAPDPWPLRSHLELGALPTAVPCARLHARQLLWEWGLNGLAETAELLVSELVTNAVKATAGRDRLLPVRLHLSSDKERLLIEVWDADPRPPLLTRLGEDGIPALGDEGGRGLFLVATLSQRWNWYASRKWGGKVVWCEVQLGATRRSHDHHVSQPTERSIARDDQPGTAIRRCATAGGQPAVCP
jgi:anti-sigma regulatory factor (Ser/Thr protein kinase)